MRSYRQVIQRGRGKGTEPRGTLTLLHTVLMLAALCGMAVATRPAVAAGDFDTGLGLFKAKRYAEASRYFDRAAASTPWESSPLYYSALSYHYAKDFKHAIEKYDALVQKFPGTTACNNAIAALRVVDPGYFTRKESAKKAEAAAAAGASAGSSTTSGSSGAARSGKDTGTVEGDPQTRVYFTKQGSDKLVDIRVGGRSIKALLDQHGESTAFSRGQLSAIGIQAGAGKEVRADLQLGGVVRKNFPVTVDDSVGSVPRIGNSFLNAFACDVDEAASFIDLRRKGNEASSASGANQLAFKKEGKDVIVDVMVNGRSVTAIFDPQGGGFSMSVKAAKAAGLKVDDAEDTFKNPAEGPQRGEPGWVPPDERPSAPKNLTIQRMKLGPVERSNITAQISEKDNSRYPKLGADFVSGGWKFDIDYSSNVIRFRH